uniref:Uncharacterized protein n=1 Tax=Acrobeloides nanus TaxID=290746 RepID=A0A914E6G8_9BILA
MSLLAVLARTTPVFMPDNNDIIFYKEEPILLRPLGSEYSLLNWIGSTPLKAKRNLVIGRGDLTFRPGRR